AKGALLCYCTDGGYSRFYGADPEYALERVDPLCSHVELIQSYTCSDSMSEFADHFSDSIMNADTSIATIPSDIHVEWEIDVPLRSQMIDELKKRINFLIADEGMLPEDIAVIAPFVDTVLECSLVGYFED